MLLQGQLSDADAEYSQPLIWLCCVLLDENIDAKSYLVVLEICVKWRRYTFLETKAVCVWCNTCNFFCSKCVPKKIVTSCNFFCHRSCKPVLVLPQKKKLHNLTIFLHAFTVKKNYTK